MLCKIFLALIGIIFAGYGLMCFVVPQTLGEFAQFGLASEVAQVEVRAMYGGLQFAVGLLAILGAFRPALQQTALLSLCFLFAGLAGGRLIAILLAADAGTYNYGAFVFEAVSLTAAVVLMRVSAKAA